MTTNHEVGGSDPSGCTNIKLCSTHIIPTPLHIKSEIISSAEYISAKILKESNMLNINDFAGCEPNHIYTEL